MTTNHTPTLSAIQNQINALTALREQAMKDGDYAAADRISLQLDAWRDARAALAKVQA